MARSLATIDELWDNSRYELLNRLSHSDMIPFVLDQLGRRNWVIRSFFAGHLAGALIFLAVAVVQVWKGHIGFWTWTGCFFLGLLLGTTVVIPIHEAIHGLGYRLAGASRVTFGSRWRQFYWYAVADRWVAGPEAFCWIAFLPFLMITAACMVAVCYLSSPYWWIAAGFMLMHGLNCAGDFAILGFYWENRDKRVLTYDEVGEGESYFFVEKIGSGN